MKKYIGKSVEAALNEACVELNRQLAEISYYVVEEKKGIFSKKVEIMVYTKEDIGEFIKNYIRTICNNVNLECDVTVEDTKDIINVDINCSNNSLLIGKNGITLQMLNQLVRAAVKNEFRKFNRILLNVGDYKDNKYEKIEKIASRCAKEVLKTKATVVLDPMPADERRIIHNALSKYKNIKTESIGSGLKRQITIKYVE